MSHHTSILLLTLCMAIAPLGCERSSAPGPAHSEPARIVADVAVAISAAGAERGPTPASRDATEATPPSTPVASAPAPAPDVSAPAAPTPAAPPVHLTRHSGSEDGPLAYLVVEPAGAGPDAPLVLALHGRGDRADRFANLAEALGQPVRTVVVRGPIPFGMQGGRQWYHSGTPGAAAEVKRRVADLAALVEGLRARYPGAPKPALYGFSQGAVVALQALAERPELWSGVAALSGYLMTAEDGKPAPAPVPLLVAAGVRDRVITADRSWAAADALAALGHAPERLSFASGHSVPEAVRQGLRALLTRAAVAPAASDEKKARGASGE